MHTHAMHVKHVQNGALSWAHAQLSLNGGSAEHTHLARASILPTACHHEAIQFQRWQQVSYIAHTLHMIPCMQGLPTSVL